MDSIRKILAGLAKILAHPIVVVSICMSVIEYLPQALASVEMLPPAWHQPIANAIGITGVIARIVLTGARIAAKKEADDAALAAATQKAIEQKPPEKAP